MNRLIFAVIFGLCASVAHAGPSINIGIIYDYMDGDKSTYLKRIYNSGATTAFVRVSILEMTFDATGKATETPLDSQGTDASQRKGLVASPARLIIPAKGMQATRMLYLGDRERERYYRVRFIPVVPEKADQFNVSEVEREAYKETMSAGVNIMAGYGAAFFVRPKNTRFDTKIQNDPIEYRVENTGNSTVILDEFKDCSIQKANDCADTRKLHVRPGTFFKFVKEPGRIYQFKLLEGSAIKELSVKS
ncbi:fimbrial biogenesis chaperone [Pseudomonas huaxiensis]|uniref:molecular chaperone n=1 Tax=Pseudomonas huaxiensis TaxID=2213017 RepID=UPI000DA66D69|nr:molecular chaperone [Pseudomonas huaxiensis]